MILARNTLLFVAVLLCAAVYSCKNKNKSEQIDIVTPPTEPQFKPEGSLSFLSENDTVKQIEIEIADNTAERMQGLMHRSSMSFDKGMLFIFDREEEQSFWMKNTKMSLDIIYVNANKEIVSISKHTQPYSKTPIPSMKPALYVVETAAGFADRFGVKVGDRIAFSRTKVPA